MRCAGERHDGDVTVLDIDGTTGLGDVDDTITRSIVNLTQQGRRTFVLNLANVTSVDSHALGDLAGSRSAAERAGATLTLTGVQPRVVEVLRVMNLSKAFGLEGPATNRWVDPQRKADVFES